VFKIQSQTANKHIIKNSAVLLQGRVRGQLCQPEIDKDRNLTKDQKVPKE